MVEVRKTQWRYDDLVWFEMNELWSLVSIEEMLMQLVFGDHYGSGCAVVIVVIHG
jgi:hypothetical protein